MNPDGTITASQSVADYRQTDRAKQLQAAADAKNAARKATGRPEQVVGGKSTVGGPFAGAVGGISQAASTMFGGGGGGDFGMGGGAGGAGGAGGGGGTASSSDLTLRAEKSPDLERSTNVFEDQMKKLQDQSQKVDQNLQFQVDQYKSRLGEGPTTRAIERSASAIRDQMAGMQADAEQAGAATGRGKGFQAGAIGEAGQRALAGSSADIALGRERDLDALTLGGQGIMAAPGQRQQAYDQMSSNFYSQNPYNQAAQYGLGEKQLGLQAYGQQGDLAIRQAALQQQQQGSPMDWFRMLYGG